MPRGVAVSLLVSVACALLACDGAANHGGNGGNGGGDDGGDDGQAEVQIGTYDQDTLDFNPLEKDGDVPLRTFGQGGTHAAIAVRCIGFGNTAFVDVDIENIDSANMDKGSVISSVKMTRPQLLLCRDDEQHVCDDLPLNVMTGGLADPGEKDGLHIRITAKVHSPKGVTAKATQDGVLRKDF
jgi:hypothetical protein